MAQYLVPITSLALLPLLETLSLGTTHTMTVVQMWEHAFCADLAAKLSFGILPFDVILHLGIRYPEKVYMWIFGEVALQGPWNLDRSGKMDET